MESRVVKRSFKKSGNRHDFGLSLIELLVVIIILGILSGIAVLGLSGARNLSQQRACEVDYASTVSALKSYKNDWPDEPISSLTLQTLISEGYLEELKPDGYSLEINNGEIVLKRLSDGTAITSCAGLRA
jgi:prepilin-type N-terminal cleavage/methylation domain-containing protein